VIEFKRDSYKHALNQLVRFLEPLPRTAGRHGQWRAAQNARQPSPPVPQAVIIQSD
jgi:RecB family endonuclease NucS